MIALTMLELLGYTLFAAGIGLVIGGLFGAAEVAYYRYAARRDRKLDDRGRNAR